MNFIISIILLCVITSVNGAQLFGINLTNATRDELRIAVKNANVKLVQEAGIDSFYDIYKGETLLHNAQRLYLGFVKKDQSFAFAEYEFNGLQQPEMLNRLNKRYGPAKISKGKFMTDQSYSWLSEGIQISLYQDWPAYKTRLSYSRPDALQQLKNEQIQFNKASSQQKAVYLEQAY